MRAFWAGRRSRQVEIDTFSQKAGGADASQASHVKMSERARQTADAAVEEVLVSR